MFFIIKFHAGSVTTTKFDFNILSNNACEVGTPTASTLVASTPSVPNSPT